MKNPYIDIAWSVARSRYEQMMEIMYYGTKGHNRTEVETLHRAVDDRIRFLVQPVFRAMYEQAPYIIRGLTNARHQTASNQRMRT